MQKIKFYFQKISREHKFPWQINPQGILYLKQCLEKGNAVYFKTTKWSAFLNFVCQHREIFKQLQTKQLYSETNISSLYKIWAEIQSDSLHNGGCLSFPRFPSLIFKIYESSRYGKVTIVIHYLITNSVVKLQQEESPRKFS